MRIAGKLRVLLTIGALGLSAPAVVSCRSTHDVKTAAGAEQFEWKQDRAAFDEHLAKVQPGWSLKRLIGHAGPPTSTAGNSVYYRWVEHAAFGGHFVYYMFTVRDGSIVNIDVRRGVVPPRGDDPQASQD